MIITTPPMPRRPTAKENWKEVDASFIGFDKLYEQLSGGTMKAPQGYPPYNIRSYKDNTFRIEVATAGFALNELSIELTNENKLIINGAKNETEDDSGFSHKGIASRDFQLMFSLALDVEVTSSEYKNGLLTIKLDRVVPENDVRRIEIQG